MIEPIIYRWMNLLTEPASILIQNEAISVLHIY